MKQDQTHWATYLEVMGQRPTRKEHASRTLRRWFLVTAALTSISLAVALEARSKALHDAEWACQVGADCKE